MCSLLPFSIEDKIKMLKEEHLSERIMIAIRSLNKVRHLLRLSLIHISRAGVLYSKKAKKI